MGETQGTMKAVFASVLSLLIIGVLFVALSPDDVSQSTSVAGVAGTELQDLVEFLPPGKDAGGHISGMGKCSSSQVSKLKRGIDQAAPFIRKAIDNRDTAAWTKWFGAATSQQSNADVQARAAPIKSAPTTVKAARWHSCRATRTRAQTRSISTIRSNSVPLHSQPLMCSLV